MKMQIKEFAEFTGVSVRTLHYYDEIGLLVPAYVDGFTGYRYYDENSLLRMQEILFYRELDFSLKAIGEILSSPNYDKNKALKEQKHLLMLKKERFPVLHSDLKKEVPLLLTKSLYHLQHAWCCRSTYKLLQYNYVYALENAQTWYVDVLE